MKRRRRISAKASETTKETMLPSSPWGFVARTTASIALLVLTGCSTDPTSAQGPGPPDGSEAFTITAFDGRTQTGQLRRIRVPARWDSPGSDSLSLAFLVLPAIGDGTGVPHLYLAGGPGNSPISGAQGDLFDYVLGIRQLTDVVLIEQRGVGLSTPSTACNGSFGMAPSRVEREAALSTSLSACVADLAQRGVHMSAYDTQQSVLDIEAVRADLAATRVTLDGHSYGTHLALAYIREFGGRVERAVLRGVEGPDHTLKLPSQAQTQLETIGALVAADPTLGPQLPDLVGYMEQTLTDLDANPRIVDLGGRSITIDGFTVRVLIANLIGERDDIQVLVSLLTPTLSGDWTAVATVIDVLADTPLPLAMTFAVDCAAGASSARLATITAEAPNTVLGDAQNFPFPAICASVGSPDLGPASREPIASDVPTLFVSGTLDGRTPVSNADDVAAGFTRASRLVIDGAGHTALDHEVAGFTDLVVEFLSGNDLGNRRLTMPPLSFPAP